MLPPDCTPPCTCCCRDIPPETTSPLVDTFPLTAIVPLIATFPPLVETPPTIAVFPVIEVFPSIVTLPVILVLARILSPLAAVISIEPSILNRNMLPLLWKNNTSPDPIVGGESS